ncbi:CLUMA_CG014440, isoform A [Clunio marinus]|uniref:CLUMA_CG014440, isoform A n=1 Tax=Clunio marinus TaxID=568069 RepID=A0A1J1INH7_9DIPT|nr:CLUMA_CG014440, isoform A [Clunio marinus]
MAQNGINNFLVKPPTPKNLISSGSVSHNVNHFQSSSYQNEQNQFKFLSPQVYETSSKAYPLYQKLNEQQQVELKTPVKNQAEACNSLYNASKHDDASNIRNFQTPSRTNPETKSLCDVQDIAVIGCDKATKLFAYHSKRPFFKKIDLLCDRLSQDLSVTNKAVVNINSHGITWAIKDYIFVFNRIMNAWVILRDYYYSKSEGMQCVQDTLDPNFREAFLEWQEVTGKLAKTLVNSFENLHNKDLKNGNRKLNKENSSAPTNFANSKMKCDPFQSIFDPMIAENSEKIQLSGGYLKSAVYRPVSSPEGSTSTSLSPDTSNNLNSLKLLFDDIISDNEAFERKGQPKPLYKRGVQESTPTCERMRMNLSDQFRNFGVEELSAVGMEGFQLLNSEEGNKEVKKSSTFNFEALKMQFGENGAETVICLMNQIMSMPESLSFLGPSEALNFPNIPNLIHGDNEISLTQIIDNIQKGNWKSICDVFIHVKMLAEYAKAIIHFNSSQNMDTKLKSIVWGFVRGVESALARYA